MDEQTYMRVAAHINDLQPVSDSALEALLKRYQRMYTARLRDGASTEYQKDCITAIITIQQRREQKA